MRSRLINQETIKSALVMLFFLVAASTSPTLANTDRSLLVHWQNGTIEFESSDTIFFNGPEDVGFRPTVENVAPGLPEVDCAFRDMRTHCFQTGGVLQGNEHAIVGRLRKAAADWQPYGINLQFVIPIAVLPSPYLAQSEQQSDDALSEEATTEEDVYEKAKIPSYVRSLAPFEFQTLPLNEIASIVEINSPLGVESLRHTFAAAESAIGGSYALSLWRQMIGRVPTRYCLDGEDYCSVVVEAKIGGNAAIAYCAILNSEIGLGIPFNCSPVARVHNGKWYVLSYDGPEQCDGCGAGSGAYCTVTTDKSVDDAVTLLQAAIKTGRTNMLVEKIGEGNGPVVLVGRNQGTASRFFEGYFDKSYGVFQVSRDDSLIIINSMFNLLISATRSRDENYREFGAGHGNVSNVDWFQTQVQAIIESDVLPKLGPDGECSVLGIL